MRRRVSESERLRMRAVLRTYGFTEADINRINNHFAIRARELTLRGLACLAVAILVITIFAAVAS